MKKVRGVYERDRGSGIFWIRWADGGGLIHREKVGTRELAIAAYQKRKSEVREGRFFPRLREQRVTFGDLVDEFKKAKPNHWSKGLIDIIKSWFADYPARSVTPQKIQEKMNALVSDGRTDATANRYRAIIGAVYSWAIRNGRIERNPARMVPLRREENHRIRFLEAEEETRLRKVIHARHEPEFTLALNTGMRLGEMMSLAWGDVDLERKVIQLRKTKSGRPRSVPINADALTALKKLRKQGRSQVMASHPRYWFEAALTAANVKNFRWHDLRHTFASRLVMAGVNLRTVQELLGHQTIAMTIRYSHLAPSHLRAAVESLRPKKTGQ